MKEQSSTFSTVSTISSFSQSSSVKFAGLIQETSYKRLRNALFSLFDYVAETSPPFWSVHKIVGFWRLLLIFLPSICPGYFTLWEPGTTIYKLNRVISVLYSIVPVGSSAMVDDIFLLVTAGLFIIGFIVGISSAIYYQKNAKLNRGVVIFIDLFFAIMSYIIPPMMSLTEFRLMSHMITHPKEYATTFNIVSVVINIIVFLAFLWLFSQVYAISIIFKPDSLMTVTPAAATLLGTLPIIYCMILGLGSNLDLYPSIVCQGLAAIAYFFSIKLLFFQGGLVRKSHQQACAACFISAGVMLIVDIVIQILHIYASILVLLMYAIVWIVAYAIVTIFMNSRTAKILNILDILDQNEEEFPNYIHNASTLLDYAVTGFRYAHPACISWKIFRYGISTWPENVTIWFLYGKFMAIYPEETSQIVFISSGIQSNHLHGVVAKHMVSQVNMILKQREPNLIPDLKNKLDKVGKQVQRTRGKIRYVWDLILQGHTNELETAISSTFEEIERTEAELLHLLIIYPSSRFVARAYARFVRDILGDNNLYQEWQKNASLLQRGIPISPDQAHDLGLLAFPNLPSTISSTQGIPVSHTMTEDTLTVEIDADDEKTQTDAELRNSIRESIDKLKLPAYTKSRRILFFDVFILFFCVILALTIYVTIVINQITEPLNYLQNTSTLRTYMFRAIGYAFHYAGEYLDDPDWTKFPPPMSGDEIDGEIPSTNSSKAAMEMLLNEITEIQPQLTGLMSYRQGDEKMNLVRNTFFAQSVKAEIMLADGTKTNKMMSVFDLLSILVTNFLDLIKLEVIPASVFQGELLYNTVMNLDSTSESMTECIDEVIDVIKSLQSSIVFIVEVIFFSDLALNIACVIAVISYIIISMNKNKSAIFTALTMLPKQVVSQISENFKVLKKEDEDGNTTHTSVNSREDFNRQEENMLKIFSTSSGGVSVSSDSGVIIFILLIIACLNVGSVLYMTSFINSSSETMVNVAPHIDSITASYTYDFCCHLLLSMIAANNCNPPSDPMKFTIAKYTNDYIIDIYNTWETKAINAYFSLRYGDESQGIVPFITLGNGLLSNGDVIDGCSLYSTPKTLHQSYHCFQGDTLVGHLRILSKNLVISEVGGIHFLPDNEYLINLWHITGYHLYDNYYYPMFERIIPLVGSILDGQMPIVLTICWLLCLAGIIFALLLSSYITRSETRMKYGLRLILHAPAQVVFSNQHLVALISGNFSKKNATMTTRDDSFFDLLVNELPDGVIIFKSTGEIESMNKAGRRVFNIQSDEEVIGKSIEEFASNWGEQLDFKSNFEKEIVITASDGTECHLSITNYVQDENIIINIRDITQTTMYNKLIEDECNKSNQLLSSILPPALVPRVQAGETNISFSVQSATITFMDIVSFTPWCGSNTADYVMRTLNNIYKYFDENCAQKTTMTKIKCIGDCYMAAGGIFMDVNQPAIHSKEVVEFGLLCINSIHRINKELDEHLQIRVGINTGGPIVAGVLGTTKPTFEILGPAIQMAQQMEHNGIPMKVHISRSVYELIYGGNFNVKERGEIEVKHGRVVTYIVSS